MIKFRTRIYTGSKQNCGFRLSRQRVSKTCFTINVCSPYHRASGGENFLDLRNVKCIFQKSSIRPGPLSTKRPSTFVHYSRCSFARILTIIIERYPRRRTILSHESKTIILGHHCYQLRYSDFFRNINCTNNGMLTHFAFSGDAVDSTDCDRCWNPREIWNERVYKLFLPELSRCLSCKQAMEKLYGTA